MRVFFVVSVAAALLLGCATGEPPAKRLAEGVTGLSRPPSPAARRQLVETSDVDHRCALVRQTSFAPCQLGRSFGCDPASGSMWVTSCRGEFRCSSSVVRCGYPPGRLAYNCSCGEARGRIRAGADRKAHASSRQVQVERGSQSRRTRGAFRLDTGAPDPSDLLLEVPASLPGQTAPMVAEFAPPAVCRGAPTLVSQTSRTICAPNVTFGCDSNSSFYVLGGCRGGFRCSGAGAEEISCQPLLGGQSCGCCTAHPRDSAHHTSIPRLRIPQGHTAAAACNISWDVAIRYLRSVYGPHDVSSLRMIWRRGIRYWYHNLLPARCTAKGPHSPLFQHSYELSDHGGWYKQDACSRSDFNVTPVLDAGGERYVEVMRKQTPFPETGGASGQWYWHAPGSGVWLRYGTACASLESTRTHPLESSEHVHPTSDSTSDHLQGYQQGKDGCDIWFRPWGFVSAVHRWCHIEMVDTRPLCPLDATAEKCAQWRSCGECVNDAYLNSTNALRQHFLQPCHSRCYRFKSACDGQRELFIGYPGSSFFVPYPCEGPQSALHAAQAVASVLNGSTSRAVAKKLPHGGRRRRDALRRSDPLRH